MKARNIYGWASAESPIATATAIDAPGKMDIPTVAITTPTSTSTTVDITWTAPTLTHGSAVDAYEVQFKTAAGLYVTTASCNPAAASAQFTARKCTVPMTTIITLTSLSVDRVI